jgi:hypothetical protein
MNIFLLLIFMAVLCPSCRQDCKSNQGLSKHRRTCRNALSTTIGLLGKRKQKLERVEAIKTARKAEKDAPQGPHFMDFEMGDIPDNVSLLKFCATGFA